MEVTSPELFFRLRDGHELRSVEDLMHYLPNVSQDEFDHHVNDKNNDFAQWIQDVFHERDLAGLVRPVTSAEKMLEIIIGYYEGTIKPELTTTIHIPEPEPITYEMPVPAHEGELNPDVLEREHDELADRFDQAARRMDAKTQLVVSDEHTKRVEVLEEKERDLHQRISESRKAGYDPFLADIILQRFRSRLTYANATLEDNDFAAVESILEEVEAELDDANKGSVVNVKKEIEGLANA